jgi:peptide/nickel transport system substrate-binding protein
VLGVSLFSPKFDITQLSRFDGVHHFARHYSGLLQFDPTDGITVKPDLATEWSIGDNFTSFTVKLRSGVKWHDGKTMTAEDVIFALNRWAKPPSGVLQPRAAGYKAITSVEKIDETTIKINIAKPSADFVEDMADSWHMILPKHILELEGGVDRAERLTGTGPFKFKNAERDNFIASVANPDYFAKAPDGKPYPYLDAVTSVAFGDFDSAGAAFLTQRVDRLGILFSEKWSAIAKQAGDKAVAETYLHPDLRPLILNNTRPPFDNLKARKAVFLAIDRRAVLDVLKAPGIESFYAAHSYFGAHEPLFDFDIWKFKGFDPSTRQADLAEAKALATEVGLKEFDLVFEDLLADLAQVVVQQLADAGMKVNMRLGDSPSILKMCADKSYQAISHGTAVSRPSILAMVDTVYMPGAGRNCGWTPPENWLGLVDRARATPPGKERNEVFMEMDRIMREEWIPLVPLHSFGKLGVMRWNYVRDMFPLPGGLFQHYKLETVWLDGTGPAR